MKCKWCGETLYDPRASEAQPIPLVLTRLIDHMARCFNEMMKQAKEKLK